MSLSDGQKLTVRALTIESGKLIPIRAVTTRRIGAPVLRLRVGLPPRVLRRVDEYIDVHLGETIRLDTLADVAGLSPSHFSRMFKQSKGVSPGDYLARRRVERTKELLDSTDLSVAEIALAVGFSDQSHCSRSFRKLIGICPREYRCSRHPSHRFTNPEQNSARAFFTGCSLLLETSIGRPYCLKAVCRCQTINVEKSPLLFEGFTAPRAWAGEFTVCW